MRQPRPNGGPEPSEDRVSHAESVQTPEEILAYWTPERMSRAEPREIRLPGPDEDPDKEPEDGSANG
ncbi:MAG: hypothetical protein K0Q84_1064 [Arthrobacter sp.]|nr:hypothetical protein [Arthrobacter sp.]